MKRIVVDSSASLYQLDGVDFATRMQEIHAELLSLQAESNELMNTISNNLKDIIYE